MAARQKSSTILGEIELGRVWLWRLVKCGTMCSWANTCHSPCVVVDLPTPGYRVRNIVPFDHYAEPTQSLLGGFFAMDIQVASVVGSVVE